MMFAERVRTAPQDQRMKMITEEIMGKGSSERSAAILEAQRGLNNLRRYRIIVKQGAFGPMVDITLDGGARSMVNSSPDGKVVNTTAEHHGANALRFLQDLLGMDSQTPIEMDEFRAKYEGISVQKHGHKLDDWYDSIIHELFKSVRTYIR